MSIPLFGGDGRKGEALGETEALTGTSSRSPTKGARQEEASPPPFQGSELRKVGHGRFFGERWVTDRSPPVYIVEQLITRAGARERIR